MTAFPDDAAIERLSRALLDCTLPKAEWTHAAHFAAALWLLRFRADLVAEGGVGDIIRRYNASVGGVNDDHNGYHETITRASLAAAADLLSRHSADTPLDVVHAALMDSSLGKPGWLFDYWARDRLMSVEARRGWVAPDLRALPFALVVR